MVKVFITKTRTLFMLENLFEEVGGRSVPEERGWSTQYMNKIDLKRRETHRQAEDRINSKS